MTLLKFPVDSFTLDTSDFARNMRVGSVSVRHRLCTKGSWYGVVPLKMPSGRLVWPDIGRIDLAEMTKRAAAAGGE